ncbi:hypothetical protein C0585_00160 [Candidatus Woesearchaeota archaeon]|nr:MAG: hypothetical protein C0585_00160 [Candidatus Woesearchaeota archaeon]
MENKKKIINHFLEKDFLISENLLNKIISTNIDYESFDKKENNIILNEDIYSHFEDNNINGIDWKEFEKFKVLDEKGKNKEIYKKFLDMLEQEEKEGIEKKIEDIEKGETKRVDELESNSNKYKKEEGNVEIVFSYDEKSKKRTVLDFVNYFRSRFKQMEPMFKSRLNNNPIISINKIKIKSQNDKISLIGIVSNISLTKNGHIIIELEDLTGKIKILFTNRSENNENYEKAKEVVLDEMIAIEGTIGQNNEIIFGDNILFAELSLIKELKKSPKEEYVVFIGDPHIGADMFLAEEFENMIKWLNGDLSDNKKIKSSNDELINLNKEEEEKIISKIKYLIITGDIVDGVGIYPAQESDLFIKDIKKQYDVFAELLKKVPSHIKIIINAGNHDAMRIAEPQPIIYKEYAEKLCEMTNVIMISNPGVVNIGKTTEFEGFNCLLYHGYSFTYYADVIEDIRSKGGLTRADLIMQILLKKRHLAPSHGSTLYIPDSEKDNLVIEQAPDFFVTGHIHRLTSISNYKGISLLNCSTWMGETAFQEKVGLKPQIAKLPVANLKTREILIFDFEKDKEDVENE